MTRHIPTGLARKIHSRPLEIIRVAPSPSRYPIRNTLQPLRIIQQRLVHIRSDIARRDRVDGNTSSTPPIGKTLGHLSHRTLTRRISRNIQSTLEGEKTSKVDDAAPSSCYGRGLELEHVRADVSAEGEDGVEVHLHDLVEVAVRELLRGVSFLDAGAGYEDADLVAVFENFGGEGGDVGLGGELGGVDPGLAAEGFDGLLGGLVGGVALIGFSQKLGRCKLLMVPGRG